MNSLPNKKNLRLVRIESICRQQNKCDENLKFVLGRVENIVGKGENAVYQHNFSFSHNVFKWFLIQVAKSCDCVVKI